MSVPKNKKYPEELNIGQNIRKYRVIRGYEQKEFAALLKITPGTLSKYENNNPIPGVVKLQIIASLLCISMPQLMTDPANLLPPL